MTPPSTGPITGHDGEGYRPEIDGLRAIAVLAVVLYHFAVPGVGGGFVGVDIFFVISGFLIGGILWRELATDGRISFQRFYIRRIKRLAPAFAAMAIATTIAAYFILLPMEFREYGKTLIASSLYFANIYFYRKSGYFDTGADEKPLLHTWSLSVEEQFYIVLPILFFLLRNRRDILQWLLIALVAVSLVLCVYKTFSEHTAAFFLFQFRAWELGAGVLLAMYASGSSVKTPHHSAISWLGLGLLAVSIAMIQPGTSFPGFQAILPVAGALLLIYNGRQTNAVNQLLSSGPAVFVGKISYSLYLWHWPVLTLGNYHLGDSGTAATSAALLALSFVLAIASWRFVELPTRYNLPSMKSSWLVAGASATAMLAGLGSIVYLKDGLPNRFGDPVRAHIDATQDFNQDWTRCTESISAELQGVEVCPIGPAGRPPQFLVWGDSHVRAIKEGLAQIADEKGAAGWLIWRAGCPPLFDITKEENSATSAQNAACLEANSKIREAIKTLPPTIRSIVLVGRWSYYVSGRGVGIDDFNTISLKSTATAQPGQEQVFDRAVPATVSELAKHFDRVFVLQQPPEMQRYSSKLVARGLSAGRIDDGKLNDLLTVTVNEANARAASSETPFLDLASQSKIVWLRTWPKFCDGASCGVLHDGKANYFDNNHITNSAASRIRDVLEPLFSPAAGR